MSKFDILRKRFNQIPVGEKFEYNGEWYQCVEQPKQYDCATVCELCSFNVIGNCDLDKCSGTYRSDSKSVIFKKLEKVGEPHFIYDKIFKGGKVYVQNFMVYEDFKNHKPICDDYVLYDWHEKIISIEIKQNKEDMEEKKLTYEELEHYYDSTCGLWAIDRDPKQVTLEWIVENAFQLGDTIPEKVCASNLKPFDLEAAKAGKPVCTRDGRKARILCYDLKGAKYPIVAAIETQDYIAESISAYDKNGRFVHDKENNNDLMMLLEKKEGWINIYTNSGSVETGINIYKTEEIAKSSASNSSINYLDTIKIEWKE